MKKIFNKKLKWIFDYDNFGNITRENRTGNFLIRQLNRAYDSFGREISYAVGNVNKATYGFDAQNGRLNSMNAINAGLFQFNYLANSNLQNETIYPNGMKKITTFEENRDLMTEIKNQKGIGVDEVLSKYSYQNDALGRRINQAKSGSAVPIAETVDYAYNSRSEVTTATSPNQNFGFSYDNLGNRISAQNATKSENYVTNNLNQ